MLKMLDFQPQLTELMTLALLERFMGPSRLEILAHRTYEHFGFPMMARSVHLMKLNLPRPGDIQFFLKHSIIVKEVCYEHLFTFCEWLLPLPQRERNWFGKPIEVWHQMIENMGSASFIPVCRIMDKVVHTKTSLEKKISW